MHLESSRRALGAAGRWFGPAIAGVGIAACSGSPPPAAGPRSEPTAGAAEPGAASGSGASAASDSAPPASVMPPAAPAPGAASGAAAAPAPPVASSRCAAAEACKKFGKCLDAPGERCGVDEASCRASTACESTAACVPSEDATRCVATRASCQSSARCREDGECQLGEDQTCIASAELCRKGEVCSIAGRCGFSALLGMCVARSHEDCRRSKQCKELGMCRRDPEAQVCLPGMP